MAVIVQGGTSQKEHSMGFLTANAIGERDVLKTFVLHEVLVFFDRCVDFAATSIDRIDAMGRLAPKVPLVLGAPHR